MSLGPDALQALVRELVADALADRDVPVSVADDAELNAFAAQCLELFSVPERREAFEAGKLRFRLTDAAEPTRRSSAAIAPPASPRHAHSSRSSELCVEAGALTERAVQRAASDGKSIVLGRRAVATPLALDKARSLGVAVRREAL
jgi:hypothetical protein